MNAWTQEWVEKGFPWCDTCKKAAVFSEHSGYLHSTPEHSYGLPKHLDPSGHQVAMTQWTEAGLEECRR